MSYVLFGLGIALLAYSLERPRTTAWSVAGILCGMVMSAVGVLLLVGVAIGADYLPNLQITPGVARQDLTVDQICKTKWGKDERAVTEKMKVDVFRSYGYAQLNADPRCPCEIDHLVSRELGGADDIKNLWPQSYSGAWNAHMKDRVENRLHREVCAGSLSLEDARSSIVRDWTAAYVHYFGAPNNGN